MRHALRKRGNKVVPESQALALGLPPLSAYRAKSLPTSSVLTRALIFFLFN